MTISRPPLQFLILAFLLGLPMLVGFFQDHKIRQQEENRTLEKYPSLQLLLEKPGDYIKSMEGFLEDHYGFAVTAKRVYRKTKYRLFRDSPSPRINLGEEGTVFFNSHPGHPLFSVFRALCTKSFHPTFINETSESLTSITEYYRKLGIRVIFGIVPSKASIYPDRVPPSVPAVYRHACSRYLDEQTPFSSLAAIGHETNAFEIVYPFKRFIQQRNDPGFYPVLNFHWKGASVNGFAQELIERLDIGNGADYGTPPKLVELDRDLRSLWGIPGLKTPAYGFNYEAYRVRSISREKNWGLELPEKSSIQAASIAESAMTSGTLVMLSNSFGIRAVEHLEPIFQRFYFIYVNRVSEENYPVVLSQLIPKLETNVLLILVQDSSLAHLAAKVARHLR